MSLKLLIGLIITLGAIGGGTAVYINSQSSVETRDEHDGVRIEGEVDENGIHNGDMSVSVGADVDVKLNGTGSITDLIARGGEYKCTFSSSDPNAESSGTVYIDGNLVRGDFTSSLKAGGQVAKTHMIQKDGYVYTWMDGTAQGFKLPVAATQGNAQAAAQGNYSMAMGSAVGNYACEKWNGDSAQFSVPASVNFMSAPTVPGLTQ